MYQNFEKIYGNLIDYVTLLGAEKAEFKTKLIYTIVLVIFLAITLLAVFFVYSDQDGVFINYSNVIVSLRTVVLFQSKCLAAQPFLMTFKFCSARSLFGNVMASNTSLVNL